MGGVLPGEDQALLDELHPNPFAGQALDQCAQVIQVAGEPVHAVHRDRVTVAGEPQQLRELGPGSVPPGSLVREDPVQDQPVELASLVLIQSAYPHIPNPLACHGFLQPSNKWN
jgi:hypothetical protein